MHASNLQPLVETTRGRVVECIHYGALVVVDAQGRLVASVGDPQTTSFLRSTAKPFQALPFVEAGGPAYYGLTDREVAILCASHSGTDEHVAVVRGIQSKIGVSESDLLCGTHTPAHQPTVKSLVLRGENPTPLRHNCSGKHSGMLAYAKMRSLPLEDYVNPNHPIQQTILATFAEMCGLQPYQVETGIDGCSAPNFAVPLIAAAQAFASLCKPDDLPAARAQACQHITRAMSTYPDMVGGPDRFDTRLMEVGKGLIVSKGGAEGYQGIGLMPGALGAGSPALGIALKISDGDPSGRAETLVSLEILRWLGALSKDQLKELAQFDRRPLTNWRKLEVGDIHPCFSL